jgi:glycosyltransferase involved in cell wall biosynthesis
VAHITAAAETVRRILIHDLRRLRPHVDQIVFCGDGPAVEHLRNEGFAVHVVAMERKIDPMADLRTIRTLVPLLRENHVDLVHTYAPKAGLLGQLAAHVARVPKSVHGCRGLLYMPTMSPVARTLFSLTDRTTNALADRTLYVSGADMTYSIEHHLVSRAHAVYTGSGIDLSFFDPDAIAPSDAAAIRARHDIPADAELVLTIGRYVRDKGYGEIAAAASRIKARHPRVRFLWIAPVLAGEDGVMPDVSAMAPGVEAYVTRVGLSANLRPYYAAATLLLHPTYREGVPRVLMEAAAMGTPIAATSVPGCREVLADDSFGFLFSPRDPDDLADAVERALANPEDAQRRARAARQHVVERFDQDALTRRIWAVYEELLAS